MNLSSTKLVRADNKKNIFNYLSEKGTCHRNCVAKWFHHPKNKFKYFKTIFPLRTRRTTVVERLVFDETYKKATWSIKTATS